MKKRCCQVVPLLAISFCAILWRDTTQSLGDYMPTIIKMLRRLGVGLLFAWFPAVSVAERASCDHVILTGNPFQPPYVWRDSENPKTLDGAAIAFMARALEEAGVSYQVRYSGPWSRVLSAAKNGQVDIIASVLKSDELDSSLEYLHPSYIHDPVGVFFKSGQSNKYANWSNLKGLKGGTLSGISYGRKFDAFAASELTFEYSYDVNSLFKKLALGRVDYVLYQVHPALLELSLQNMSDKVDFRLLKPALKINLHAAISKKSPCISLSSELNRIIRKLAVKNVMFELSSQYLVKWEEEAPDILLD